MKLDFLPLSIKFSAVVGVTLFTYLHAFMHIDDDLVTVVIVVLVVVLLKNATTI